MNGFSNWDTWECFNVLGHDENWNRGAWHAARVYDIRPERFKAYTRDMVRSFYDSIDQLVECPDFKVVNWDELAAQFTDGDGE